MLVWLIQGADGPNAPNRSHPLISSRDDLTTAEKNVHIALLKVSGLDTLTLGYFVMALAHDTYITKHTFPKVYLALCDGTADGKLFESLGYVE